jgi:hypothetical protein
MARFRFAICCLMFALTLFAPCAVAEEKPDAAAPQPLTAEEVEELTARAEEPGPEVAGGALSNEHLTYIVIALAAAVIVLIVK